MNSTTTASTSSLKDASDAASNPFAASSISLGGPMSDVTQQAGPSKLPRWLRFSTSSGTSYWSCNTTNAPRAPLSQLEARAQAYVAQHASSGQAPTTRETRWLKALETAADPVSAEAIASALEKEAEDVLAAAAKEAQQGGAAKVEEEQESAVSTAFLVSYFLAGGAAGATSRTVVSPLERLKIIMQVQPHSPRAAAAASPSTATTSTSAAAGGTPAAGRGAYSGVMNGLVKMWREEGFAGMMRGNGVNCLRIIPYSAVQFSSYEVLKNAMRDAETGDLDVPRRLTAGALAGIASVVSTYPLDLVRSRISLASASLFQDIESDAKKLESARAKPPTRAELRKIIEARQKKVPGIWGMLQLVYRNEDGVRGLYKGCVPTSVGVAPYVAINFYAFESLKRWNFGSPPGPEDEVSTLNNLICGGMAGTISQTLTYPLDVVRRRMQVVNDVKFGGTDKSSIAVIRGIVKAEGFFGLYRGITPNLLKVAPSIATSFATYSWVKDLVHHKLHPDSSHSHHH